MSDSCNPMDLSGSSVHGILQARILEWVAIYKDYLLGSFQPPCLPAFLIYTDTCISKRSSTRIISFLPHFLLYTENCI